LSPKDAVPMSSRAMPASTSVRITASARVAFCDRASSAVAPTVSTAIVRTA
jgi:hypothetical protein